MTTSTPARAPASEEAAFAELAARHERELRVHCYRMLGNLHDAEDLTQETLLRAWRRRETYAGRAPQRAWLYKIATNACLDLLAQRKRRPVASTGEVPWLQPFPDALLEGVADQDAGPAERALAKEGIELAFIAAIQHLPPRQRAVLITRDVLEWPAADTADLLETSVASVNSALQRARATMRKRLGDRDAARRAAPGPQERELLERYLRATEEEDVEAFLEILSEDASFTMPPQPGVWRGSERIVGVWRKGGFGTGRLGFRCVPVTVNRQPAFAVYTKPPGEERHRALALDVLAIEDGEVVDIHAFEGALFPALGLPPEL